MVIAHQSDIIDRRIVDSVNLSTALADRVLSVHAIKASTESKEQCLIDADGVGIPVVRGDRDAGDGSAAYRGVARSVSRSLI